MHALDAGEAAAHARHSLQDAGEHAQNRNQNHRRAQRKGGALIHVMAVQLVVLRLTAGVLLPEQRDVDLQHVAGGHARSAEEDPLADIVNAEVAQLVGVLQDALVDQGLAQVAVEQRNARQTQRAQQERRVQQRLATAKATQVVELQLVQVHVHHARRHEQRQLQHGVVHHVHHSAAGGHVALLAQQHRHGHAHGDVADLGHGRAGEDALEVGREQRKHRAQRHGDQAQRQHHVAEGQAAQHGTQADHQHAEHAGLGEHAAEQCAGRGGGHRMRLGQPDVQREQARLRTEAHQDQRRRQDHVRAAPCGGQRVEGQGANAVPGHEQAHQRHHAAEHRDGEVRPRRAHRARVLIVGHPGIGGQRHDLEEDEGGVEVVRHEHAQRRHQRDLVEQVVAGAVLVVGEVFRGHQARHQPHERRDQRVQAAEAVQLQRKTHAAERGYVQRNRPAAHIGDEGAHRQREHGDQFNRIDAVAEPFAAAGADAGDHRAKQRHGQKKCSNHVFHLTFRRWRAARRPGAGSTRPAGARRRAAGPAEPACAGPDRSASAAPAPQLHPAA